MARSGYVVTHTHAEAVIFKDDVLANYIVPVNADATHHRRRSTTKTNTPTTSTPSMTPDDSPLRSRHSSLSSIFSVTSSSSRRSSCSDSLATKLRKRLLKLAHKEQDDCSPVEDLHVEADHSIEMLPGAQGLLEIVHVDDHRLSARSAMMCSGSSDAANECISSAGITLPRVTVTPEDLDKSSKPSAVTDGPLVDPAVEAMLAVIESILVAADRMNRIPSELVVFEDSPSGIRAAQATGAQVIAVCTGSHPWEELEKCRPNYLVDSLKDVEIRAERDFHGRLQSYRLFVYERGVGMSLYKVQVASRLEQADEW
ncbi:hypothetical protein D9758_011177 [Tetrapyrgos nigripes]|uniref:Uncharacterized protein n=1 Tax=Tetrapyrgos nigripes TaxID=182062 RepID=A0A8H5D6Q3_9AGAR|nr:hypothetical protein D9758_011177 [Tetrapyrgos nigripes]